MHPKHKILLKKKISNCTNNIEQECVGLSLITFACTDIPFSSMQTEILGREEGIFCATNTIFDSTQNQTKLHNYNEVHLTKQRKIV